MSGELKNKNNSSDAEQAINRRNLLLGTSSIVAAVTLTSEALAQAQKAAPSPTPAAAQPAGGKPNILVIWGDDIGIANISAYSNGLMGYETPNIDRIGREGIKFLHYYGEQSCTAGRAAFLTGQHGIRSGLTKVGFPGAPMGMSQLDPIDRRPAQESRLCHRTVRQEPCRRSQRIAADRERLRRVFRQSLPSQRRGGAGTARLSQGPQPISPSSARAAC